MPVRSCKVTIEDLNGVSHTVEVTAATLYEAVALGMAAIRTDEWVTGNCSRIEPRQGSSNERCRGARGQAGGFHKIARQGWWIAAGDDGAEANSVHPWDGEIE